MSGPTLQIRRGELRDSVSISVELIAPLALERGLRFAIREGNKTVGAGAVTEIMN